MEIIVGVGTFIAVVLLLEGIFLIFRTRWNPEVQRVKSQLRHLAIHAYGQEALEILRSRKYSEIPWLNKLLASARFRPLDKIYLILQQSGSTYPIGVFLLLSLIAALLGFLAALWITGTYLIAIIAIVPAGSLPFFYILMKKRKRMEKFERQLPEALDLVGRAMRAGQAFSGGLQMVAQEFDDPAGIEFGNVLNEINYGVSVEEALKNLLVRVDCPDLKFFAIAVIIQRESGGNLAEIMENISRLIRERFKLQGRIRTLSAEGKLSAVVLIAIPFLVAIALSIMRPEYIKILTTDPIGKLLIIISLFMLIVGIFIIKEMIKIKV
jgi:tight adherence protein B